MSDPYCKDIRNYLLLYPCIHVRCQCPAQTIPVGAPFVLPAAMVTTATCVPVIVIGVILGAKLLTEAHFKSRLFGSLLILAGIALLSFSK